MEAVPFVGRDRELAFLADRWDRAQSGAVRVVVIAGEAGTGKSRLALQVAGEAAASGAAIALARNDEERDAPPFWLWRQLVHQTGGELPASSDDRRTFFDEVVARLLGLLGNRPAVLVLDDLQWSDQPSLLLLRHFLAAASNAAVLVLATVRTPLLDAPPVLAELSRDPAVERLDLSPFSLDETARCLDLVATESLDPQAARRVFEVTGGNPFFVTEVARSAITPDVQVPASVLDVVAGRVELLPEATRALLRTAAVVGDEFAVPVIATLLEQPAARCLVILDDARAAGFVVPSDTPGSFRFAHALVRMAIEVRLGLAERVELHRASALAIEALYGADLEPKLAELARHWAAVAATGEHDPAVAWARRAGDSAMAQLAYEEAARLYHLALDAGGPALDPGERADLLIKRGVADWRALDLDRARRAYAEAVQVARRAGRPELIAEVVLAMEAIGDRGWDRDLREWCEEALAGVAEADTAVRARLLARLTESSIYGGDTALARETSRAALDLADASGDPMAVVTALRARQLASSGPDHLDERENLAARMIDAGLVLRRPSDEMWGRLWRIDTLFERGDLSAVASELGRLAACAARVGGPMARWHLLISRAAWEQATAQFDAALASARQAFELMMPKGHPAAFGAYMALIGSTRHHLGYGAVRLPFDSTDPPAGLEERGEVRAEIFVHLGPALELAEDGRLDAARAALSRPGPIESWAPPPYFAVAVYALAARVAGLLGDVAGVEFCHERLSPYRGRHVVTGAGTGNYFGPVELTLGRAARQLDRFDEALADLEAARAICDRNGARAFAIEANCELALALDAAGDAERAREIARAAADAAKALGMAPWVALVEPLTGSAEPAPGGEALSRREREVADLVGAGLTNREIAARLFLSERTAENHVQHILTKLGFSNRSQIAAWVSAGEK